MVTAYSIFRKVQRSLHSSNFSQSLYPELTQTFISRLFFSTFIPSWCSDHGLSVPRLSTLLWQLLPLHFSRPELQLFIASELKKVGIPARKEQTDWSFRFRFSLRCWQFCFSSGEMSGWSQQENAADTSSSARLPAFCSRLHRSFTREKRPPATQPTRQFISVLLLHLILAGNKEAVYFESISLTFLFRAFP